MQVFKNMNGVIAAGNQTAGAPSPARIHHHHHDHDHEEGAYEAVRRLASGNAVVVFSMSGCCMCTVAKRLLLGLGVGPTVVEVDELGYGAAGDVAAVLRHLAGAGRAPVPAVFVGGRFLGGIETLMACHINGTLVPLLKEAGALWL